MARHTAETFGLGSSHFVRPLNTFPDTGMAEQVCSSINVEKASSRDGLSHRISLRQRDINELVQ